MNSQQNAKPAPVVAAMAILIAAAGAGFFLMMAPASEPATVEAPARVGVPVQAAAPMPPDVTAQPVTRVEAVAEAEQPSSAAEPPSKSTRLARDLEREQIWSALGRKHNLKPAAPGSAAPSESAAALLPALDREYVREAIREQLVPVAVDCYNTVLTTQDAKAGGKLVLKFTIIGDEEVGGVVEEASIDEESTLDSEFLRECLRESVMAVTFEPPPNGGRVEVTYPLTFEPD